MTCLLINNNFSNFCRQILLAIVPLVKAEALVDLEVVSIHARAFKDTRE